MRRRIRGQVLVETSLTLWLILFMTILSITMSYLFAQKALVFVVLASVCEAYAESPDIQGTVSASVPYLWFPDIPVGLPPMNIIVADHVFGSHDGVLHLFPLPGHPPPKFSCTAVAWLGGDFPILDRINITISPTYTTTRRYGGIIGQTPHISAIASTPPLLPPLLPVFPVALLRLRRRRTGRVKGQALVEYALASWAFLLFIVSSVTSVMYCITVMDIAGRAGKTIALAALGDNPSAVDVSFSNCSFAVGQPVDCGGLSPFSLAAPYVPSMSFTGGAVLPLTISVYGGR